MRSPNSLKQEFLKNWILGLQISRSSSKKMNIFERKKAIKLSADIAMASARNGATCWSRALISNYASNNEKHKVFIEKILRSTPKCRSVVKNEGISVGSITFGNNGSKKIRCKKILRRSRGTLRKVKKHFPAHHQKALASSIAKRLDKKRTKLLKKIVPGGEMIKDEISLIEETLDYVMSLKAQVDVMRSLANATEMVMNSSMKL